MKPGKTFVLSKTTKRMMALMGGTTENRNQFKRMMIDAQLSAAVIPRSSRDDRNNNKGKANYAMNNTGTASTAVE
jgi:hypothetical protein